MGVYSDLLAQARSIDTTGPSLGGDSRAVTAELVGLRDQLGGDVDYPALFDVIDAQQVIGTVTADDGTYTLTIDGVETGNINHDDDAEAIQTAVDTALAGDGYTAGDVAVSGGPIDAANVILDFVGGSFAGRPVDPVVITSSLTSGGDPSDDPSVTTEIAGQPVRPALAILNRLGVITGDSVPVYGTAGTLTAATTRASNPYYPDQNTIRALAREAAIAEGNADIETEILRVAGLSLDGR